MMECLFDEYGYVFFYMSMLLENGFICECELMLCLLNTYDGGFYQNVMKTYFYTKCPF